MAFSIRNIFQKGGAPDGAFPAQAPGAASGDFSMFSVAGPGAMPPQGSPFGLANQNAVPPGLGGAIFKTRDQGEDMDGQPVAPRQGASPFSPFGQSDGVSLTVADILPQLPPEVARVGGAQPDQPVAISSQALEAALASGQLAVPLFEVYRVCPALFQVPISPQDPRVVPLPHGKLAGLMSMRNAPPASINSQPMVGASPFAAMSGAPAPAYSQPPPQGAPPTGSLGVRPAGSLPPRRPPGTPPSTPMQAEFASVVPLQLPPREEPPVQSSPFGMPQPMPQPNGGSPFSAAAEPSPFGMAAPAFQPPKMIAPVGLTSLLSSASAPVTDPELAASPSALGGSPFAAAPSPPFSPPRSLPPAPPERAPFTPPAGASPFSMPEEPGFQPAPAPPARPLFTPAIPSQPADTFGASPFASLPETPFPGPANVASFEPTPRPTTPEPPKLGALPFGSSPMSTGAAQAPAFGLPGMSSASRPMTGGGAEETMEISLAAVLKGQTPQDLGFDPNFIPAWINTKLPAAHVRQQLSSGRVLIDLGSIIDGTENTFRTVIAHGRRDYQVKIPAQEIFHLLPPVSGNSGPQPPEAAPSPFAAASQSPAPPAAPEPSPPQPAFIQPLGFQLPFTNPSADTASEPKPVQITSFDPFAAISGDWQGKAQPAFFEPGRTEEPAGGLGSEQLFQARPEDQPPAPRSASSRSLPPTPAPAPAPAPVTSAFSFGPLPELEPLPEPPPTASEPNPFFSDVPRAQAPTPVSRPMPSEVPSAVPAHRTPSHPLTRSGPPDTPAFSPPRPVAASAANQAVSFAAASSDPDQMLLRALLGVSTKLDAATVVQLTAELPGILAAVCVNDHAPIAHGGSSKAAQDFIRQADDTARSMRNLASLIGIAEAETLSITTGERLITFHFNQGSALGVLHAEREPASGLRDKVTLIGRELAKLL